MKDAIKLTDRINTAGSWMPADCLRHVLAEIESGAIDPIQLVIIYRERNTEPEYEVAGQGGPYERVGVVSAFLQRYMQEILK